MGYVIGLLVFALVLILSVGLHEAGHMVVARKFKISVPRFAVGMGPKILAKKIGKTEYSLRALPIGGFVEILDPKASMDKVKSEKGVSDKEKLEIETQLIAQVHPFKRFAVFIAGPVVNLVLATFIIIGAIWAAPMVSATNEIDTVKSCESSQNSCTAQKAGLKPGDKILKVNGHSVDNFEAVSKEIDNADKEGKLLFTVERNGNVLKPIEVPLSEGKIGVDFVSTKTSRTLGQASETYVSMLGEQVNALMTLPSRIEGTLQVYFGKERSDDSLSSVVTVGRVYGHVGISENTELEKIHMWAYYAGALNLALGFINLLPILPLDGGRIFLAFIDLVKMGTAKIRRVRYAPLSIEKVKSMTLTMQIPVLIIGALIILAEIIYPQPIG